MPGIFFVKDFGHIEDSSGDGNHAQIGIDARRRDDAPLEEPTVRPRILGNLRLELLGQREALS